MSFRFFSLFAFFMSFSFSAQAAGKLYDCEINDFGTGWMGPRMIISVDESEQTAMVFDGIIAEVVEVPVPAQVSRRSESSLRLNWTVKNIPVSNVNTKETAKYKAILNTRTHKVTVSVQLNYFDNEPRGTGKCKVSQQK